MSALGLREECARAARDAYAGREPWSGVADAVLAVAAAHLRESAAAVLASDPSMDLHAQGLESAADQIEP